MAAARDGEDEIDRLMAEAEGSDDEAPGASGEGAEADDEPAEVDPSRPEINRDYQFLKQAMVNEMAAPDLLPFEARIVGSIKGVLKQQEEGVARQASASVELAALSTLYMLEADRVRYVLANYLRTRLLKIRQQLFALAAMPPSEKRELLSPEEATFVERVAVAVGDHLTDEVLEQVPEKYAAGLEPGMDSRPSRQRMVFVDVVADVGDLTVPGAADGSEAQTVGLAAGDTYVLPYDIAHPLVVKGSLVLACDTRQLG